VSPRSGPFRRSSQRDRDLLVPADLPATRQRCLEALASLGIRNVLSDDDGDGVLIDARTGANLKSWGTRVRIEVQPEGAGSRVTISAWPAWQLVDWGEATKQVDAIAARLEQG